MPIYPHRCPNCGAEFDDLRPASQSDALVPCPVCPDATPSPQAIDLKRVGVMSETSLDGWHPPVTAKMERTYRLQNRDYDRPEVAAQVKSGEMEYRAPKGMPSYLMPECVRPKPGTAPG